MRRKDYRGGRVEKIKLRKCEEICRTYDKVQLGFAMKLDADPSVKEFRCNVPIILDLGSFTTDFLVKMADGSNRVWECSWRKNLGLPRTTKLLDASKTYWEAQGFEWGLVVEEVNDEG